MLPDTDRYRNTLQLMSMASRSMLRSMTATGSRTTGGHASLVPAAEPAWGDVREQLRARGLRWTPQRRTLIEVLSNADGHVTGAELVDRCRAIDPETIPSTVYRTLDVLEELGLLRHSHAADGREEFHILPSAIHGHLHCNGCGTTWEIDADEARSLVDALERRRAFAVDVSHLSIAGRCADCVGALED
jgi:Fur family transcriptional regulator, ferric uptake regulator